MIKALTKRERAAIRDTANRVLSSNAPRKPVPGIRGGCGVLSIDDAVCVQSTDHAGPHECAMGRTWPQSTKAAVVPDTSRVFSLAGGGWLIARGNSWHVVAALPDLFGNGSATDAAKLLRMFADDIERAGKVAS